MKSFAVLSALVACGLAAPAADADAQILAGGVLGHGLVGGVYASGPAVAAAPVAAPVAVAHAAPLAVAHAPLAVAAPVVHAAPVAVATAPVVHQVGYQVHHQVHHVPQVSVQKHVSTH